jgi:hypothetical protein
VVTATKINQAASATLRLRATDMAGGVTNGDPALLTIGRGPDVRRTVTLHHVPRGESHITLQNGTPGLDEVRLRVDGHAFELTNLVDGEVRTLDVSAAMRRGDHTTVTLHAVAPRGGTAVVLVSDSQ